MSAVVQKLLQEQIVFIKNILTPLVDGGIRQPHVEYVLKKNTDLDRFKADQEDAGTVAAAFDRHKDEKIAAVSQAIKENNRIRRDVLIARANHKRLMAASVRTAYNKQVQLEYLLNGLGQKKDKQ